MRKFFAIALVVAVTGGWMLQGHGWSQQPAPQIPAEQPNPGGPTVIASQPVYDPATRTTNYAHYAYTLGAAGYGAARSEIDQLIKQLGEAEDSTKKSEITKQLEAEVAKSFDRDMEQRETDLKNLEERVKKLHAQLDRRRKAKDDIIQLQIKVLINEAEGLGFGGQRIQSGWVPGGPTSPPAPLRPAIPRTDR